VKVFASEPAAVGPGTKLVHGRAHARVDALTERDDAYAVTMAAGHTYRLNLVARGSCVGMALYPPGTTQFDEAESIKRTSCGGYMTFTPGPDAGGLYSIRITPSGGVQGAQRYTLHVAAAGPDDVGPGLELRNGETPRDGTTQIRDRLRARLRPGRYFVTLRVAQPVKARYTLGLQIRDITTTVVNVDGSSAAKVASIRPVTVTATVTPASASGGCRPCPDRLLRPVERLGVREAVQAARRGNADDGLVPADEDRPLPRPRVVLWQQRRQPKHERARRRSSSDRHQLDAM
jgi:hypothetical protein